MTTKKCFKCGRDLPLDDFYKHPRMADGHLNKCKECTKKDVHEKYCDNVLNPEYVKKERKRCRGKYYRLYVGLKVDSGKKKEIMLNHKLKFPEKHLAQCRSGNIIAPEGMEKHHWSYNEEHYKDVIFFSKKEHMKLHRYMIYDQERMMYRTMSGVLLDTKLAHLAYFESIKELD